MITHDVIQRSPEWFALRCGRITASEFDTMAAGTKAAIETLCLKTATERVTGRPIESTYSNEAMLRGIELESLARQAYETTAFVHVRQVGFIERDEYFGCSPDGLIDDDGGCEIKCPQPHTHTKYIIGGGTSWKAYRWQVQGSLWITGRAWWDFVSFSPEHPVDRQMYVERVSPDAKAFKALDAGAAKCRERIDEIIEAYNAAKG